jgi:tetratricopeptide (TPR) repeat protein
MRLASYLVALSLAASVAAAQPQTHDGGRGLQPQTHDGGRGLQPQTHDGGRGLQPLTHDGGRGLQDDPHAACTAPAGWVPREILKRPLPLRPGTGNAREEVTTASAEARAFYVQGLNYLHGYVWIEAARSFNQALRLDPGLAMAYVGLSRVYSGLEAPADAERALAEAQSRAAKASPRERRRIAVRAVQLDAMADLADTGKHAVYKKAIDDALAIDIDDVELWLIRGNAEEPTAAGRGQRGGWESVVFYKRALQLQPDSGAAHHYLTHTYETIGKIPEALEHGEAYAALAPAIPHSHHMWGHDLRRVGRIDDAIAAFLRTDALEKAYYAAEGISPEMDWHHVHNLDLLATAYQYKGQMRLAEERLREMAALPPVTDYLEFNQKTLASFLLDRGRAAEALAAARTLAAGRSGAARAAGRALEGHALLALGRAAEARSALAAAERERGEVPTLAAGLTVTRRTVDPWVDTLRGEILLREGQAAEGGALLRDVQKRLRALPGPDAWIQALFRLEGIARVAREAGAWDLAEYTAEQMIEHDAAYAGSHVAMAAVARHAGDAERAAREIDAARRGWADADPDGRIP